MNWRVILCWLLGANTAWADLPRHSFVASVASCKNSTGPLNYWGHPLDGYAYISDSWGLRTNITRQLGLSTNVVTNSFDGIGQLVTWSGREANGTLRQNEQLAYAYDPANNLQYRTSGAMVQTFTVNTLNEMSSVARTNAFTVTGATPAPVTSVTVNSVAAQTYGDFTFASTNNTLANGNNTFTILAHYVAGTSATNALTVNLPTNVVFQYDANGNMIGDGTRVFAYDAENQLTNVFVTNLWQVTFLYDGLNRRRIERDYSWQSSVWMLTNETRFIYDGMQVIQERDTNNNPQVTYTRGLDLTMSLTGAAGIGGILARTDANGSTFYHSDGAGNITALIDGNQNIVARGEYDGFGKFLKVSGSLAPANRIWFSSKEWVSQPGIYNMGGRFYEPNFGRFVNRDPIQEMGGLNLYRAMANNSINYIDPYGLAPGDWWDLRTWVNSGFAEGWTDSASSIGQAAGGSLALAFDGLGSDDAWRLLGADRSLIQGEFDFVGGAPDVSDSAYGAITGFDPIGILPTDPNDSNMEEAAIFGAAFGMLYGEGEAKLGKVSLSKCKKALEKVHEEVGWLPKGKPGKFGSPQRGTSMKGYRLDPPHARATPGSPDSKPHINWWDYTGGKRTSGGRKGSIPIE
jgi:RHS repeat-associated protein